MTTQRVTLTLEGITAGDYLTWIRDPEPPALGRELQSIEVRAEPLGDTVDAVLTWNGVPPAGSDAGPLAGFPLTPEVAALATPSEGATSSVLRLRSSRSRPRAQGRECYAARLGPGTGRRAEIAQAAATSAPPTSQPASTSVE
jgi:hypothetical protein